MKEKINIAEILKDKPVNTKLYSPLFSEVYFSHVSGGYIAVEHHGGTSLFLSSGRFYDYDGAEPLLFPSREMRDWNKFNWKKGDVLVSNDGKERVIFEKFQDNRYLRFFGKFFSQRKEDGDIDYKFALDAPTNNYTLEDKDVAQIYINTIEERLCGKLNRETLEVEKTQHEFKDGDIAFADYGNRQDVFIVSGKTGLSEGYSSFISIDLSSLTLSMACRTSFFKKDLCKLRLATEEEKQQLFDALAKKGKAWDAEKKQIVDIKKELQFKPFEKVLVRDSYNDMWRASFFSHIKEDDGRYVTTCFTWKFCIPYIGNESLVGTTKDVEG